jgi:choice-of-anchor C domain-containing protein
MPATLALLLLVGQQPSLIVNGSFEQGPPAGRFVNLVGGTTSIPGWKVTGEGIDVVGTLWKASRGLRSIDLDGSSPSTATPPYMHGGIAQTFATTPGTQYQVTFDLAGNGFGGPRMKPFRVSAAGQSMDFDFDVQGKTPARMGWVAKSWTFTAKDTSTTLEFRSLTTPPLTGYGAAIDNVSVTGAPASGELNVRETEKEIEVSLGAEILFDTGKYALRAAAETALKQLATLIRSHPGLPILIEGHTDSVGRPEANLILSRNRANAVKEWLVANGIAAGRITTKGYGQAAPVASNADADGRQRNRRVEVRLQKGGSR